MKINVNNIEKTQAELNKIQIRCKERCYSAKDIQGIAQDFAARMERLGVSRSKLDGCFIDFGGNYKPANAYKYAMIGTVGTISFTASGAFLTYLGRSYCTKRTGASLTDAAKESIIKKAENQEY